ncbi:MAG TPA: tetratricopeptide repeat protein [Candidatus Polarisedimenticolaceae bacterium]
MLSILLAAAVSLTTAEEAVALLAADGPRPSKEVLEAATALIDAAAKQEPANTRWRFGRAIALMYSGNQSEAKALFEAVAAAEPARSEYQYWYGASVFETIDEVGMLGKMSAASKGKAALEKAIALDPGNVRARQALFRFYLEAPGIAGGSVERAREQAQATAALPAGAFRGRMMLGEVAAKEEDWAAMSKAYVAAETAGGTGASPTSAMTAHAFQLIRAKKDPAAALPVIERLAKVEKPGEYTSDFLRGEARSALGDCAGAVESYARVLEKQPDARNTRYSMAACLEKLGRKGEAATHYDEFARRFPKDDRAGKARDQAAKLRKG